MRTYLLTAPGWLVGLSSGLILGTGFAAVTRYADPRASWLAAAIVGVVVGVLSGAALAFAACRQRRELRVAAGDLPPAQLLDAYRAAVRGPVPVDPQIRAAAARVARRRIETARQTRILTVAAAILLAVGAVLNTLTGKYGLAVWLACAALANGAVVYEIKRLRRRLERLSAEDAANQGI
ncbi:hypothetical protein ACFPJ1_21905 [Kribbella qitaiheensis]|uniref:hypothetical protein n=1 Tax=Kribbella qitaiheensis TaxID=1544730 RepID=UPI003605D848